jgi:hypothetical protein
MGEHLPLMLLIAAIPALIFANIGFSEEYEFLRHFKWVLQEFKFPCQ